MICTGLGNYEWNQSAPHGAGRLYSRKETENHFTLSAFKKEMEGIFTTSVDKDTLDECPMAYKNAESIMLIKLLVRVAVNSNLDAFL